MRHLFILHVQDVTLYCVYRIAHEPRDRVISATDDRYVKRQGML